MLLLSNTVINITNYYGEACYGFFYKKQPDSSKNLFEVQFITKTKNFFKLEKYIPED